MLLPFNVYQIRGRSDELGIKVALLLFLLLLSYCCWLAIPALFLGNGKHCFQSFFVHFVCFRYDFDERGNVLPQGDYPNLKDYGGVMGI